MKSIDVLAVVFVVVGALNWGLVGLFQFDLVAALLGDATLLSRLVYVAVGVAGLFLALQWTTIHDRWVGYGRVTTDLASLQSTAAGQPSDNAGDRPVVGAPESG
jgi:uncharacterized membrane protein YuzA (DUF378 family)